MNDETPIPAEQPEPPPLMNRIRIVGCGERRAVELMIETPIRDEKRLNVLLYRMMTLARGLEYDTQKAENDVIETEYAAILAETQPPEEKSNIITPNGFSHP